MVDKTLLIGGGVIAAGIAYYMSQNGAQPSTLEDTQATSYVGVGGDGDADNRTVDTADYTEYLQDCASSTTGGDATSGDNTTDSCETPLWSANETITLTHPLAATNSDFAQYTFTVTILADIITSGTQSSFDSMPDTQVIGDYSIGATRSGAFYESGRWTADQNATFANGAITKSNALTPASSVAPTWDEVLAAFGGYMPGKIGGVGDEIILRSGSFSDVGEFRYTKQGADGEAYPVLVDNYGLNMSGSVIPMFAQMAVKCGSGSWTLSGTPVQITSANTLVGDDACWKPCFPAVIPTSGIALGCSLPTVTISYPSKIHVYCDGRVVDGVSVQDCSQVPTTSLGGKSNTEWWNLNENINTPTTMQKGGWTTPSGAVWGKLFDTFFSIPRVYSDAQGWYVYASSSETQNTKHYINSVLPGFMAAYARQTITCNCPSDTVLAGTTFALTDKSSCPGGFNTLGGSDEWKTTHCGGLKPDYGCTDSRATNYNENKVKDPTDNDVCNPKYCNYASNVVLPECTAGGGGGGLDLGGDVVAPVNSNDDDDTSGDGLIPIAGVGSGIGSGGGYGGVGGNNFTGMAEGIKLKDIIHTGHSFMNW